MADGKGIVLYDFLLVRGGAERLTMTLVKNWPSVELGFGYRNPKSFPWEDLKDLRCHDLKAATNIPAWRSIKVMRAFRNQTGFLADYDWVLYSGTNAPLAVHNHPHGRNILYCHTLPRFVYDLREYYLARYPWYLRPALLALMSYVKHYYEPAIAKMDLIITNSENVKSRLRRYLGREAVVVHPPCDVGQFCWQGQGDYYLSLARLECFKQVDRIIEAFKRMPEKRLIVASGGSESNKLRVLAEGADNIEFAGWLEEAALQNLIGNAIATIYIPRDEDFGMSPVESMAAGKPVIGVAEGGLLETVVDGETGILIPARAAIEDLCDAMKEMTPERARSMRAACEQRATLFSREIFIEKMKGIIRGEFI